VADRSANPTTPPSSTTPRSRRATALALALLACIAFGNARDGEFLYDDFPYVADNLQAQQPTAHRILLEPLAGRPELGLYRPLPLLTYALQSRGRGKEAPTWPFHAFNVACHAGVALLVWRLGLALALGDGVAALGAALFAVHPCHLEAVNWIVGRAELLAALFGLGFLVLALRDPTIRRARDVVGAALLLALAALSKESAFALPFVLIVLELALGRSVRIGALVRRHWPWAVVLAALLALRIAALSDFDASGPRGRVIRFGPAISLAPFADLPWPKRLLVAGQLLGEYFRRTLLPLPPRIFFHQREFEELAPWSVAGAIVWLAGLALAWRRPPLQAALLAFPVSLLTVLNLRPIQETFAERFLYLPSAFALLAVAAPLAALVARERARRGRVGLSLLAPAGVAAALLVATWSWNPIFDGALPLWRHNVACAPDLPFPHYQFAYFLHDHAIYLRRDAETPGAVDEYETALKLNDEIVRRGYDGMPPDQRIRAHLSLGEILLERLPEGRRDPRRAREQIEKAIEVGEATAELDLDLGRALFLYSRFSRLAVGVSDAQAGRALDRALKLKLPDELRKRINDDLDQLRARRVP